MRPNHAFRTQDRTGGTVWQAAASLALTLLLLGGVSAPEAAAEDPPSDGCHVTPSIDCVWGEHKVDLFLTTRLRAEYWRARTSKSDIFYAARTRVGLKYSYGSLVTLFGEFQDARLSSLSPNSSGVAGAYRTFS